MYIQRFTMLYDDLTTWRFDLKKTVALAPTIYTIVPSNIPFQRHSMGWKCYERAAKDPEFLRDGFDSNYNCVFDPFKEWQHRKFAARGYDSIYACLLELFKLIVDPSSSSNSNHGLGSNRRDPYLPARLLQLGRRRAPDRAGLNGWFPHFFFVRPSV
ncbi:hypothetical protein C8R48DRAFT_673536 [Suillus tomentosus]|nr:hypothetical protein C8R48DRAFT_673536 [Suillus tomentosus]